MATVTIAPSLFDQRPATGLLDQPAAHPGSLERPGSGPTLDDVIAAAWQEIERGERSSCLICHGELRPVWAAGPRPVGGHCQDCGARLS